MEGIAIMTVITAGLMIVFQLGRNMGMREGSSTVHRMYKENENNE